MAQAKAEILAKNSLHECCRAALAAGKGCCGLDAAGLQAKYAAKVEALKAAACSAEKAVEPEAKPAKVKKTAEAAKDKASDAS